MTDLHLHTTASDGALSPTDLVTRAVWCGVDWLAVTDHDTFAGLDEARRQAEKLSVGFTNGVELSLNMAGESVHMLAYGFDQDDPALSAYVAQFRSDREHRAAAILSRLAARGVTVPREVLDRVVGDGVVGRMHLAKAVVEVGGTAGVREAFDLYLGDGRPCHVRMPNRDASEAISLVRQAGGISVLAHPGEWTSHRTLTALVLAGLDGLEVWHPSHDARLIEYYMGLADRHGLTATGGSDFHGPAPDGKLSLGSCPMPEPRASLLRERLRLARRRAGRTD